MTGFEHERFDVYQAAIQFLLLADGIASALPRGRGYLGEQRRRAASSISFNIAEGAGEFAPEEKARFYRMARRSATESAAIPESGRLLLLRIVAMLTAMAKRPGSGSGSGSTRD